MSAVAVRRGSITTIRSPAALLARASEALVEHRMAPGEVRADQHDEVGQLEILVVAGHDVGAEGAAVAGDRRGHAEPRIGVDVGRADEALHQLVGDVVVLGQQLAGDVEGDRVRPVLGDGLAKTSRRRGRAPRPSLRGVPPISGWSSRPSRPIVSPSAEPFEQSRPKLAGWSGSPRDGDAAVRGDLGQHAAAHPAIGAGGPHRGALRPLSGRHSAASSSSPSAMNRCGRPRP